MSKRMRFRARYAEDPGVAVGARVLFDPAVLVEEWSTGVMQRPVRLSATEPRPGNVLRVIAPRPQDGRDWWEVWAEDPAPHVTTVEVMLTVMGDVVLATPGRVKALLEHLASQEIRNDLEAAEVASGCMNWLHTMFPGLSRASEYVPRYSDVERAEAWADGVAAALGYWPDREVTVPVPPIVFTREPRYAAGLNMSANLRVRPDAVNRLFGGHRAN